MLNWIDPNAMWIGHSMSGFVKIVNSDCPIAHSDGTTSRNSRPDAATASQISTIDAIRPMRSHVTGLSAGAAIGGWVSRPVSAIVRLAR